MWSHFTFKNPYNGTVYSNPYIAKTKQALFKMIVKYELETIGENSYLVVSERPKKASYRETKEILKEFAQEWSLNFNEYRYNYEELAFYGDFFQTYGKRYGLLQEFKENAIC